MNQPKIVEIIGSEALGGYQPAKHGTATRESLATFAFDALTRRLPEVFRTIHAAPSFLKLGPANGGAPSSLIPVDASTPFGMKKVRATILNGEGNAEFLALAGGKLPVVSVSAGEQDFPYEVFGLGIEMTYEDMQAIQATNGLGAAIYDEALRSVRRGMDKLLNNILWYGSEQLKVNGLLSIGAIPKAQASTTYISGANIETLLRQTNEFIRGPGERSKGAFSPRFLTIAPSLYTYLSSTYKEHSDRTMLSLLREANPNTTIQEAWELETVTVGGNDLGRCMLVSDYGMDLMRHATSPVTTLPMVSQKAGLELVMPVLCKTAGVLCVQALSASFLTNC